MSRQRPDLARRDERYRLPSLYGSRHNSRHQITRACDPEADSREAAKDRTGEVQAVVPVDVSAFLLNEKRSNSTSSREVAFESWLLPAPTSIHHILKSDDYGTTKLINPETGLRYRLALGRQSLYGFGHRNTGFGARGVGKGVTPDAPAPEAPSEKAQDHSRRKTQRRRRSEASQQATRANGAAS